MSVCVCSVRRELGCAPRGGWPLHSGACMYVCVYVCVCVCTQVSQGGLEPQLLVSFSGHTDAVECVSVSPNGKLIATCGWDGQLLTWQAGQQVCTRNTHTHTHTHTHTWRAHTVPTSVHHDARRVSPLCLLCCTALIGVVARACFDLTMT